MRGETAFHWLMLLFTAALLGLCVYGFVREPEMGAVVMGLFGLGLAGLVTLSLNADYGLEEASVVDGTVTVEYASPFRSRTLLRAPAEGVTATVEERSFGVLRYGVVVSVGAESTRFGAGLSRSDAERLAGLLNSGRSAGAVEPAAVGRRRA